MIKNYPSSWGQPPKIQTRDIVSLPLGGMGSSTLRNWQIEKIQEFGNPTTSQSGTTPLPAGPAKEGFAEAVEMRKLGPRMPDRYGRHLGPDGWNTKRDKRDEPTNRPIMPPKRQSDSALGIDRLVNAAMNSGKAGVNAKDALVQRAAAGDPQALNILKNLNLAQNGKPSEYIPAGQPVPGKPGSVADGKGGWSYPNQGNSEIKSSKPSDPSKTDEPPTKRSVSGEKNPATIQNPGDNRIISSSASPKKEPTAEEMAASIDKQNRAREMAAQAARQREAARKAAENQAARDAAARKMGFPNAAAAEKAGAKIGNIGDKLPIGGGGGGGGKRGGNRSPQMTAKERNDLADKRADQAAEREDKKRLEESYREKYGALSTPSSRKFWDDVEKRKAGQPSSGASSDTSQNSFNDYITKQNEERNRNLAQQNKKDAQELRKAAANEKDPIKKAQLNQLAKWTEEKDGGSTAPSNPMANIKPLSNQSGSTPTTPSSDPADIGVGGPDASVPTLNWGTTTSANSGGTGGSGQGDASGALIGWLKKRKLGLV